MGDVEAYSVSSFWPKQEFDFSENGFLEFDVNINMGHTGRSWFEIMLCPRTELKVGAAIDWLPISETYPKDRIVFEFNQVFRTIRVGTGAVSPNGWLIQEKQWWSWDFQYPNDPALNDHRIRRKMRMQFDKTNSNITWEIEREDGTMDEMHVQVDLPFQRGLVLFKTHAYTPKKDGNIDTYTFHWDNIRFTGPVIGKYQIFEADNVVYLQANGNRPIGDTETVTITIPPGTKTSSPIVLFGQVESPIRGQVLLSINGGNSITINPYDYETDGCWSHGWKSFRHEVDTSHILEGSNTFQWTVGPRPSCVVDWLWDGFSVKFLQLQIDE